MLFQRICAPAHGRTPVSPSAITPGMLNDARRAIGAGPLWGLPAAAVLVLSYVAAVLVAARAGWLASSATLPVAVAAAAVLAAAARWSRGVDFNAWLQADPRHQRGSCQWLIWRGEYSGRPCLACLASMPRRERRRWLEAAASPAAAPGRLGSSDAGLASGARRSTPLSDAGSVAVGRLLQQLQPVACFIAALAAWVSPDPTLRRTALPLALAVVVGAWLNLYLIRTRGRDAANGALDHCPVCESCGRALGTVLVVFPDAVTFRVCALCLNAGNHTALRPTSVQVDQVTVDAREVRP